MIRAHPLPLSADALQCRPSDACLPSHWPLRLRSACPFHSSPAHFSPCHRASAYACTRLWIRALCTVWSPRSCALASSPPTVLLQCLTCVASGTLPQRPALPHPVHQRLLKSPSDPSVITLYVAGAIPVQPDEPLAGVCPRMVPRFSTPGLKSVDLHSWAEPLDQVALALRIIERAISPWVMRPVSRDENGRMRRAETGQSAGSQRTSPRLTPKAP